MEEYANVHGQQEQESNIGLVIDGEVCKVNIHWLALDAFILSSFFTHFLRYCHKYIG